MWPAGERQLLPSRGLRKNQCGRLRAEKELRFVNNVGVMKLLV
jgi:hypothetical protein